MKLAIGSDHRGFLAKRQLIVQLSKLGHQVEDFGCDSSASVDYPDIALPVCLAVTEGRCDVGILLGGHGAGMSIAANKINGIRAAIANDAFTARLVREQQHCNVICLGVDISGDGHISGTIMEFLSARFAEGRHARRVKKVAELEQKAALARPAPPRELESLAG